ncbi:ankyrin repeat domain-containing protein [bacterium]|nr:ankyrin repeat domain-containing protein [bacterium]
MGDIKLLIKTIAAVVLVGCGESQQSAPTPEAKPVESVAEAAKPEPPTVEVPAIYFHGAAINGDIEAVKQHLAAGTDVNAKGPGGETPLHDAAITGRKEVVELLIDAGADVNRLFFEPFKLQGELNDGQTPLDWAIKGKHIKTANILRKHGGKTGEELKAEGK